MSATEMSSSEGRLGSQRQAEKLRHSGGDQIKDIKRSQWRQFGHLDQDASWVRSFGKDALGCLSVWRPQNLIVKVSCLNRKKCWHGETNRDYDLRLNVFFKQPQLFCPSEVLLKIEELFLTPSLCFLFYMN